MSVTTHPVKKQSLLGRATAFFVYLFEKVMPDPFVFAVILSFVGALLALKFAPNATLPSVASAWYGGIFTIFAFAFQMVLMLVAGYALAIAPPVQRGLARIAALVSTPLSAISLTIVISMILQYPLYGGLMGIIITTGLAGVLSKVFIRFSTAHTLPFFTYLTSMIITLFVPSGGATGLCRGHSLFPQLATFMPRLQEPQWQ
jgi:short-chain fatty acids transporter